ncbi:hypothetical protein D3C86_1145060 [compost metagenome]
MLLASIDQLLFGLLHTRLQLALLEQELVNLAAGLRLHLTGGFDFLLGALGVGLDLITDGFQVGLGLFLGCFDLGKIDWHFVFLQK